MRYRILLLLWLVTDLLLFVGAYAAAYFLRVGLLFSSNFPFDQHMTAAAIAAPLWLLVLATTRTFHLTRNQKTLRNGAYIGYAALVGVAFFPTLIVGVTRESKQLIQALNRSRNPLRPVAILDGSGVKEKEIAGVPVLGKLNK